MSFRFLTVGASLFALSLAGCASGGNGDLEGGISEEYDEEDLPEWVEDLPEGDEPEDNEHTDQAFFFLAQAASAEDEGEEAEANYERALEEAEAGIEADPENAQSYFQAGEAHLGLDNLEEAGDMFDRAEEIYPRYVLDTEMLREEAWIELFNEGVELYGEDENDEALPYFEQAHSIYQGRPEAMLNLAEIYSEQDRVDEAIELFEQSVEVMTSERVEDFDEEVVADWDEFLEVARFNLAQLLFRQERFAEAAEVYQILLEEDPDNLEVLSNLAIALVSSGEEEEAMELYDDLLNRPDLNAQDLYLIGVGLYQVEEWEQASRAFRDAWEQVPEHRDALFNYAQTLYLSEDFEELAGIVDELQEEDPYNENAYRFQAQALVEQDRQEEAVEILEEMEALPFFIDGMEIQPVEGGVALVGVVINRLESEGTPVDLEITFYDVEGENVGTSETTVELGPEEEPVQFQVDMATEEQVFGFSYEVL